MGRDILNGATTGFNTGLVKCLNARMEVIDGILVGVYTDDESEKVELEMWDEESKDILDRTTIGFNVGVIECLNARMEVKDEP